MNRMQKFYTEMCSPAEGAPKLDPRLLALTRVSKAQLVAASKESVWYFWEAEQPASLA